MRNIIYIAALSVAVAVAGCDSHEADHDHDHDEPHDEHRQQTANGVSFTKEQWRGADFTIAAVERRPFGQVIRATARVEPSPDDIAVVAARTGGIVTIARPNLVEGSGVSAGQSLFSIESGGMTGNNMAVRYREAEAGYNYAKQEYERKRRLAADKLVSEADLQLAKANYEAAEAVFEQLRKNSPSGLQTLTAPFTGYIRQLLVRNGEYVTDGQTLATVARNRRLIVRAGVQPAYRRALANIETATLCDGGSTYTLEQLGGRLTAVGEATGSDSPLIPVVFEIDSGADLLPGSFVELLITTRGSRPALTVPCEALVEEMGSYFVYVQLKPEFFEKRKVETGQSDGRDTEIRSGLAEGEKVVAKGSALVRLAHSSGSLDVHSGHAH